MEIMFFVDSFGSIQATELNQGNEGDIRVVGPPFAYIIGTDVVSTLYDLQIDENKKLKIKFTRPLIAGDKLIIYWYFVNFMIVQFLLLVHIPYFLALNWSCLDVIGLSVLKCFSCNLATG